MPMRNSTPKLQQVVARDDAVAEAREHQPQSRLPMDHTALACSAGR